MTIHYFLQVAYHTLLKKHAEAENTIDVLRMGARVNLYADSPAPGTASAGQMPTAQHGTLINTVTRGQGARGTLLGELGGQGVILGL